MEDALEGRVDQVGGSVGPVAHEQDLGPLCRGDQVHQRPAQLPQVLRRPQQGAGEPQRGKAALPPGGGLPYFIIFRAREQMGGHDQGALYTLRRHLLQGTGHIRDRDPPVPQPRPDQTAGVGPEEGQLRGGGGQRLLHPLQVPAPGLVHRGAEADGQNGFSHIDSSPSFRMG